MPKVRLEPVSLATWDRAAGIESDPGQDHFGPSIEESLLRWIGENGDVIHEPLLVYRAAGSSFPAPSSSPKSDDQPPVGFVMLLYPASYPDRCVIAGLRIAREQQGRGFGGAALDACIDRIRDLHPACRTLYLTVHAENAVARGLYERRGFTRTTVRFGDQLTYLRRL